MSTDRITRLLGRRAESVERHVAVAAFGKHPGWNDHIDDQGIETEALADIKQLLYVQGIGGTIDAGAWVDLPEDGRLESFDHAFVWLRAGTTIVGRFWSSTDGKGRAKYPMIVCAQCDGVAIDWAVSTALDRLEQLGDQCRRVDGAAEVIELIDRARADLRVSIIDAPEPCDKPGDTTATATIAACDTIPDDGYERVLYQIHREMASYLPVGSGSTVRTSEARPQHIRVPRCDMPVAEALAVWARFFAEHLGAGTPVLLVAPVQGSWVDAIVGEPAQAQFLCLRANDGTIPLASDVPYTLDEAFLDKAGTLAARSMDDLLEEISSVSTSAAATAGAFKQRVAEKISRLGDHKSWPPTPAMIGVGVLVVVILIVILMMVLGGGEPSQDSSASSGQKPTAENGASDGPAVPTASLTPEQRELWTRWCADYSGWFRTLGRELDQDIIARDEDLTAKLGPSLAASSRQLDPRKLVRSGSRSFEVLKATPPPEAAEPEAVRLAQEAMATMDGVREALAPGAWPARARVRRVGSYLATLGLDHAAARVGALDEGIAFDSGKELARAIERLVLAGPALTRLDELLARIDDVQGVLDGIDDTIIRRRGEAIAAAVSTINADGPLDRLADVLVPVAGVYGRLAGFAADGWGLVDEEQFRLFSAVHRQPPERVTAAELESWLFQASQDEFVALDPAADPRLGYEPGESVLSLAQRLDGLRDPAGAAGHDLAGLDSRLAQARTRAEDLWQLRWSKASEREIVSGVDQTRRALANLTRDIESASLTLAQDASSYIEGLTGRSGVSLTGSAAIDRVWVQRRDELVEQLGSLDQYATLRSRVEELEEFLRGMEVELAEPVLAIPDTAAIDLTMLERAVADRRERAVAGALDGADWLDGRFVRSGAMTATIGSQRRALDAWLASAARAIEAMGLASDQIDRCQAIDDAGGTGESIRAIVERAQGEPAALALAPAFRAIVDRLEAIDRLGSLDDGGTLVEVAMASPDLALSFAAWRGLEGVSAWPGSLADLERERAIEDRIAANLGSIKDGAARDALRAEMATVATARWVRAVEGAGDAETASALVAQAQRFGGRIEDLSKRSRFNREVFDLANLLGPTRARSMDEAELRGAMQTSLDRLEAIGADLTQEARAWVDDLAELATEDRAEVPVLDFGTIGPGTKGWRAEPDADGSRVRYFWPAQGSIAITLEFVRVDPDLDAGLDGTAFVADREVSVELAAALMERFGDLETMAQGWSDLRAVLAGRNEWSGPRSWVVDLSSGRLIANTRWLSTTIRGGVVPMYAPGLDPPMPRGGDPLNRISPRGAMDLAGLVGCRLPRAAEWHAALSQHESGQNDWNLRDATWATQRDHARAHQEAGRRVPWPDDGVFAPRSLDLADEADARVHAGDDGVLWFEPVDVPRGRMLWHLVGNVAELVIIDGVDSGSFGVLGASGLSAPSLGVDRMTPIERRMLERGYSDVGMRLTFGIEGLDFRVPIRFQATGLMRRVPFLKPGS